MILAGQEHLSLDQHGLRLNGEKTPGELKPSKPGWGNTGALVSTRTALGWGLVLAGALLVVPIALGAVQAYRSMQQEDSLDSTWSSTGLKTGASFAACRPVECIRRHFRRRPTARRHQSTPMARRSDRSNLAYRGPTRLREPAR